MAEDRVTPRGDGHLLCIQGLSVQAALVCAAAVERSQQKREPWSTALLVAFVKASGLLCIFTQHFPEVSSSSITQARLPRES